MTLFRNARLLDPATGLDEPGDLRTAGAEIVELGRALDPEIDDQVIDLDGKVLCPGLIDLRCRASLSSSGRAGLAATATAGAAGGFSTLVISCDSGLDTPEAFAAVEAASLETPIRLLPSGALIDKNGEMGEVGLMLRQGAVFVGDGGTPVIDTRLLRRALSYSVTFETWVSLRAEEAHLARETCAHESDLSLRLGLAARPGSGERMAITRAAGLAELTGAKLLFDRISTADGISALAESRARGLELAATAPISHLMFNEIDIASYDPRFRLEPPLRGESDREALITAIRDGQIDALVSDHFACTGEAKAHPFPEAMPGSANLEAVLPSLCSLVSEGELSLLEALRPLTSGPADLLGLPQGRLAPGAPADLVVFDPDPPVQYGRAPLECTAPSAFQGRRLYGKVLNTFANGARVYQLKD